MTAVLETPVHAAPSRWLPVVGAGRRVPLATGGSAPYVDLDVAASSPCLQSVADAVAAALPWYASVHRGAGYASQVSTELLEQARRAVGEFLGARADDLVVFTRNTTDALSLLAGCVPADVTVVSFASEHHANLLPWRPRRSQLLPVPATADAAVAAVDAALAAITGRALVSVTGASNVTGELWPLERIVAVAQRHGARVAVDAAQLAPHRVMDIAVLGVDYVALSGHKLYAPYGAGVLVGRPDWLDAAEPYLPGGGAASYVSAEGQVWQSGAARHEGGTPNVLGAVALAAACRTLQLAGRGRLAAREQALRERLERGLDTVPGLRRLSLWGPDADRLGVATFVVDGWDPALLATALSAEHGIGVRHGRFCAHPLLDALLADVKSASGSCGEAVSGTAVRASIGVATTESDVDALVSALQVLVSRGPAADYVRNAFGCSVVGDGRTPPADVAAAILTIG